MTDERDDMPDHIGRASREEMVIVIRNQDVPKADTARIVLDRRRHTHPSSPVGQRQKGGPYQR